MAHFAKLDENNNVTQVIVVSNRDCGNVEFPQSEPIGQSFIKSLGLDGIWKQTSYNSKFRGRFAGKGYKYIQDLDIFIPPRPYPSWNLDTENYIWAPPIPYPDENSLYNWNETKLIWELQETE